MAKTQRILAAPESEEVQTEMIIMGKTVSLLSLIAIFLFVSCEKDEPLTPSPKGNLINLQDMKIGQVNYYLRYVGEKYWDENSNQLFEYTPDTLKVEIIDQVDGDKESQG